MANERLWTTFCAALKRPELEEDPRFHNNVERVKNVDALDIEINRTLVDDTVDAWIDRFGEAGIPVGPVLTIDQILQNAQLAARGMVPTLEHPVAGKIRLTGTPHHLTETPGNIRLAPPELGQHSREILLEEGFSEDRINHLISIGAIA